MSEDMSGDITKLREAGKSDTEILDGIKSYKPEYAADIDKAIKSGRNPSDIVDRVGSYKPPSQEAPKDDRSNENWLSKTLRHTKEGWQSVAGGLAGFSHGLDKTYAETGLKPQGYQSAGSHALDIIAGQGAQPNAQDTIGDTINKKVGAAIGGSIPYVGATVGGLPAAAALGAAANYGPNVQELADQSPNKVATPLDKARAVGAGLAQGALTAIPGVVGGGAPIALGGGFVPAAVNTAKVIGADALAGGANQASQDAIMGRGVNPSQIAENAAISAYLGAGARAAKSLGPEAGAQRLASKVGLTEGGEVSNASHEVMDRLKAYDLANKVAAGKALEKVGVGLDVDHEVASDLAKAGIKPETVKAADGTTTTKEVDPEVVKAVKRLTLMGKKGLTLDQADIETARDIPGIDDLVQTAQRREALKKFVDAHNSGVQDSSAVRGSNDWLNRVMPYAGAAALITGNPHLLAADLGTKALVKLGSKAIDAATGMNNPIGLLADRMGSGPVPGGAQPAPAPRPMAPEPPREMPNLVNPTPPELVAPPPAPSGGPLVRPIDTTATPVAPAPEVALAPPRKASKGILSDAAPKGQVEGVDGVWLRHEYGDKFVRTENIDETPAALKRGYEDRNNARGSAWDSLQNLEGLTASEKSALAADKMRAMKGANKVETRELGKKVMRGRINRLVKRGKLSKGGAEKALAHLEKTGKGHGHGGKHSYLGSWKR